MDDLLAPVQVLQWHARSPDPSHNAARCGSQFAQAQAQAIKPQAETRNRGHGCVRAWNAAGVGVGEK
jgi:hypothetical protein